MIRSVAAIFARKTAIVAITGVTVIGGATLALAVEGDPPPVEPADELCQDDATRDDDGNCPEDLLDRVEPCEDGTTPAEGETCAEDETDPVEPCEDGTTPAEGETCAEDETDPVECDPSQLLEGDACPEDGMEDDEGEGGEENDAEVDEVDGERPDNHGKVVSEAAKPGGTCGDRQGRERGQCIAEIARSNGGQQAPEAPAEEPVIAETAPEEPAAAVAPAEEPAGKPAHAGPPAGKGGPPAGKG